MYNFIFNKKLNNEEEKFWKKYIGNNKISYNTNNINNINNINLTSETYPLQPIDNLIEYLKNKQITDKLIDEITYKKQNKLLNKTFDYAKKFIDYGYYAVYSVGFTGIISCTGKNKSCAERSGS